MVIRPAPARILTPETVANLRRFRLATRRRLEGRYAGAHASRRFGSSVDYADHREYVPGDDLRAIDRSAYLRLGRLLVKLFEAEDEAAVRVVVDLSASMGFGRKASAAREVAAALTAVASNGQDRVRVLVVGTGTGTGAGAGVDAGPWFRGPEALPAVEARLLGAVPPEDGDEPPGRPDLISALRRAHGEGPVGPVVLVSDLLFDGWEEVVRALATGRGDGIVVHLLGRGDVEPDLHGDLRLVDSETGDEVEVGIADEALDDYAAARDGWLGEVAAQAGRYGVAYVTVIDDEPIEDLIVNALRRLGIVA